MRPGHDGRYDCRVWVRKEVLVISEIQDLVNMRVGTISAAIFTLSSPVLLIFILYKKNSLFVCLSS